MSTCWNSFDVVQMTGANSLGNNDAMVSRIETRQRARGIIRQKAKKHLHEQRVKYKENESRYDSFFFGRKMTPTRGIMRCDHVFLSKKGKS